MTNEQIAELADKIQAECINWPDRFYDHDEAERLIRSALAAPAPQEERKATTHASMIPTFLAALDGDPEARLLIALHLEQPDPAPQQSEAGDPLHRPQPNDGAVARILGAMPDLPAPPAREDAKFPAPFEGCDHTAPERVEACWHAQLCPICATKNWHAAQRELEQLRSAPPAREETVTAAVPTPQVVQSAHDCLREHDADAFCEQFDCRSVIAAWEAGLVAGRATPASAPEGDRT